MKNNRYFKQIFFVFILIFFSLLSTTFKIYLIYQIYQNFKCINCGKFPIKYSTPVVKHRTWVDQINNIHKPIKYSLGVQQ